MGPPKKPSKGLPVKRGRFPYRHLKIVNGSYPGEWGYAYPNEWAIYLDKRMDDRTLLSIAAHEVIHKIMWNIDEATVDLAGEHIADVLTRIGFARNQGDE